jgi:hypothetical protein
MQKRPWLIATAAAVLGLGVGFYLHGVAASYGFSAQALIGIGQKPEPPPLATDGFFYRLLAPTYAALPRHAAVVMLGDSITALTDWNALLP